MHFGIGLYRIEFELDTWSRTDYPTNMTVSTIKPFIWNASKYTSQCIRHLIQFAEEICLKICVSHQFKAYRLNNYPFMQIPS